MCRGNAHDCGVPSRGENGAAANAAPKKPWFDILRRPAVAAPAFALLLLIVAYQTIIILPRFAGARAELEKPEILTSLSLSGGNRQDGAAPIAAATAKGQPLLLSLNIPTAERFSSYTCVLVAPTGAVVWRLPVSAAEAKNTLAIRVP